MSDQQMVSSRRRGAELTTGALETTAADAMGTGTSSAHSGRELFRSWAPTTGEGTWPTDPSEVQPRSTGTRGTLQQSAPQKASRYGQSPLQNPQEWEESQFRKDLRASMDIDLSTFSEAAQEDIQYIRDHLLKVVVTGAVVAGIGMLVPWLGVLLLMAGIGHSFYTWMAAVTAANGDEQKLQEARKAYVHLIEAILLAGVIRALRTGRAANAENAAQTKPSAPADDALTMAWNKTTQRYEYPQSSGVPAVRPGARGVAPQPWLSPLAPVAPGAARGGGFAMAGGSFLPGEYHDPNELIARLQSFPELSAHGSTFAQGGQSLDNLIETAPDVHKPFLLRLRQLQTEQNGAPAIRTGVPAQHTPDFPDAELLVLANRVPGPKAQGGLVSGVNAGLEGKKAVWAGSNGTVANIADAKVHKDGSDDLRLVGFDFEETMYKGYYEGYANEVAWPGKHGITDKIEYNPRDFEWYKEANAFLADRSRNLVAPETDLWVHDYHLYPQAELWRQKGHRGAIGHFDHIPVADFDKLSQMPKWADLIKWALHYDLVGVHIPRYKDNFMVAAEHPEVGAKRIGDSTLEYRGRIIQVGAFPIGIDPNVFAYSGETAPPATLVEQLPGFGQGLQVAGGVERADYTKGIPERLKAVRGLLRNEKHQYKDWKGKVSFVQVAVPSRVGIDKFDQERLDVQRLVREINEEFQTPTWTPVLLIENPIAQKDLGAWYRAFDVTMITPLADGMNLVAKETVAAQNPKDPKVLLLSKYAGAAHQLKTAVQTDPFSVEQMTEDLNYSLEMGLSERTARHAPMYENVRTETAAWWAKSFLAELQKTRK